MTMDEQSRIERLLRQLTGRPSPTKRERAAAEADLRALISQAAPQPPTPRWWRSWKLATATATVAALAVLVVVLVVVPAIRPSPAQAGLTELAQAVELFDIDVLPAGTYAYTKSELTDLAILPGGAFELDDEFIAYLVPSTREIWRDNQGTVQIRTTNHQPLFFSPFTEQAYYQAGLDQRDEIDLPVTLTAAGATSEIEETPWSNEPDQLRQQMLDHVHQSGSDLPDQIQVFNLASNLLTETGAQPPLRAAILRVLSTLDLELVEQTSTRLTLAATSPRSRYTVTLDQTGNLIEATETVIQSDPQTGIPAGTVVHQATYQPVTTITQLP